MISFTGVYKKIQGFIQDLMAICLITIILVLFFQTLCRYIFYYSIPWSEELSCYLFIFIIIYGVNISISENTLIRVDIIASHFSHKASKVFRLLYIVSAIIVFIVLLYSTIPLINIGKFRISNNMRIPMWIIYTIAWVGYALGLLSSILKIIEEIHPKAIVDAPKQ
jgi:TRAP-type C4-dicarboxylate transport system permease small subunit